MAACPSAVILEPKEINSVTVSIVSPSICHEVMTNLDRLKSRDITLLTKVCLVTAMVFPVVTYGCESWIMKKVEHKKLMLSSCGAGEDS